ncbi:uncharacterized protein LODBEIA_P24670 [Lodderomyces beijingensis]|uniref:Reduced meiotic recombination protein 1 n=1 Tax=Lodderomyces beijingensis TaxID=1775926 RepID=A0ABP0ZJC7_9ASCO
MSEPNMIVESDDVLELQNEPIEELSTEDGKQTFDSDIEVDHNLEPQAGAQETSSVVKPFDFIDVENDGNNDDDDDDSIQVDPAVIESQTSTVGRPVEIDSSTSPTEESQNINSSNGQNAETQLQGSSGVEENVSGETVTNEEEEELEYEEEEEEDNNSGDDNNVVEIVPQVGSSGGKIREEEEGGEALEENIVELIDETEEAPATKDLEVIDLEKEEEETANTQSGLQRIDEVAQQEQLDDAPLEGEARRSNLNDSDSLSNQGNNTEETGEDSNLGDVDNNNNNNKNGDDHREQSDVKKRDLDGQEEVEFILANGEGQKITSRQKQENLEKVEEETEQSDKTLGSNLNEHFDDGLDEINTLTATSETQDEEAIEVKRASIPIYLSHHDQKFLLSPNDLAEEGMSVIFEDKAHELLSIEDFFGTLRSCDDFDFKVSEEIILSIPQFGGISITEDNVYCKDLTIEDFLDIYDKLCDCTDSEDKIPKFLDLKLTTQPRFITKFNSLVENVQNRGGFESIIKAEVGDDDESSRKKRKLASVE